MQVMQGAINTCPGSRLREHLQCIRANYLGRYVRAERRHRHTPEPAEQQAGQTVHTRTGGTL